MSEQFHGVCLFILTLNMNNVQDNNWDEDEQLTKFKNCLYGVCCFRFSIDSSLNIMKKMHNGKSEPGAGHADDLCYVFR